jgi:hypothetical protein
MLPHSVSEVGANFGNLQASIVAESLSLLDQALRRGKSSPEAWRDAVQSIGVRLLTLQVQSATYADAYLNDVLTAQGADTTAEGRVNPQAWADLTDGGGSWLQGLVYAPNSVRLPGVEWWSRFQFVAGSIVKTGLGDTARGAVQAGMHARPAVKGYVRMLRGTSCARCAILAGRHYRSAVAFKRHKRCDCVNIPVAGNHETWATSPSDYFRSLSVEDQDRLFTTAGAQAIRDSGVSNKTMNQVVNVRQGIGTVTAFGKEVQVTTVGTTTRAVFGAYEVLPDGTMRRRPDSELQKLPGNRYRSAKAPRLLPEEIYHLSEQFGWDRAETLRQLRRFAYVL